MGHNCLISLMENDDVRPSDDEILEHLVRITTTFRSRKVPMNILTKLVEWTLAGRTPTEEMIREEFYPAISASNQSNIRTTVNFVRNLLTNYYDDKGKDDRVVISLPAQIRKGRRKSDNEAYLPKFFYTTHEEDAMRFRVGKKFLARYDPQSILTALAIFESILIQSPNHHAAQLARIECLCLAAAYVIDLGPSRNVLDEAWRVVTALTNSRPTDWRVSFAVGSVLLCDRWLKTAKQVIACAMHLNPDVQADGYLWVSAFFLVHGYPEKAVTIALKTAAARHDDFVAWAICGFHFYFMRDFVAAEKFFRIALGVDKDCWIAKVGMIFLFLAIDKPKEAFWLYDATIGSLAGEPRLGLPGLGLLAACNAHMENDIPVYLCDGVIELLNQTTPAKDYFQIALASVTRSPVVAIHALKLAFQNASPFVLLLRYWPVFDPLQQYAEFHELLDQIDTELDSLP